MAGTLDGQNIRNRLEGFIQRLQQDPTSTKVRDEVRRGLANLGLSIPTDLSDRYQLLRTLIVAPNVYLKILLTYCFWELIGDTRVTPTLQQMFLNTATFEQDAEATRAKGFVYAPTQEDKMELTNTAYVIFVQEVQKLDESNKYIEKMQRDMNSYLKGNVGDQAVEAARNSVRFCTTATALAKIKVIADLVQEPTTIARINQAIQNLINKVGRPLRITA